MSIGRDAVVEAFLDAAGWLETLVAPLTPAQLDGPGLGEWTMRQLVAHASRALVTVAEYLRPQAPAGTAVDDDDPLAGAGRYYAQTMDNPRLHEEVAERGRQEAQRLGDALSAGVAEAVKKVDTLVRQAPEGAVFESRFGPVGFTTYLCTRTVELVVHGTDICEALGTRADVPPVAARMTLAVMAETARARGDTAAVVAALAGRRDLPAGFGVFS